MEVLKTLGGRYFHIPATDNRRNPGILIPACGAGVSIGYDPRTQKERQLLEGNVDCPKCLNIKRYKHLFVKSTDTFISPRVVPGWVYLIKATHENVYKIGFTQDVKKRFLQIQASSPVRLELVFSMSFSNASEVEKMLHETFHSYRQHGEWFLLPDSAVAWICAWGGK